MSTTSQISTPFCTEASASITAKIVHLERWVESYYGTGLCISIQYRPLSFRLERNTLGKIKDSENVPSQQGESDGEQ